MHRPALIVLLYLLLASCSNPSESDEFSSPEDLFVDQISFVSGGIISTTSPVRLILAKNVKDANPGTELPDGFFTFSPAVPGIARWEDNRTIVYQPSQPLRSDQEYQVTAHLDKIIEGLDKGSKEFRFLIHTLVQNYEVVLDGLKFYDASHPGRMKLNGHLQTADMAAVEDVHKILHTTQQGRDLTITWKEVNDKTHYFTVEDVERKKTEGTLIIQANGDPIGVDNQQNIETVIPSLDDFSILSTRVIQNNENYISILFSDPIDPSQDLQGLITLESLQNAPRLVADLNELKVYPGTELSGTINMTIHQGIKNREGKRLTKDHTITLEFRSVKPEVRLVQSGQKSILPQTDGLILPFEAVGLNAVDIRVTKIFPENMLQYLQVNAFGGESELKRVARPIVTKTIQLNSIGITDLKTWNRYQLKLDDIINTDKGAVYQVQIGFRQSQAIYVCSNQDSSAREELEAIWEPDEDESNWDDYEYYYNPDFNWDDRDNPCTPSYYGNRRSVSSVIFASDIGIIAKRADQGDVFVSVSSLSSAQPINNADIEVYDYQQQIIANGQTDRDGMAHISVKGKPFALIVKKGDETGYLKVDDGSALSLSNFDVSGKTIHNGLKGFIYGERGIWRPQDTVHLALMLDDQTQSLPESHPVIMELRNPNDQLVSRKVSTNHVDGIYRFDFLTDSDAPTGSWQAEARVGGVSFYKNVRIETIKPNRLKLNLKFDKDVFRAEDQQVSGDLDVRWLSGATASNLRVEYELLLSAAKTTFKQYPNYSFDDESRQFNADRKIVFDGQVDAQGKAAVTFDLGKVQDSPGALNARFFGKVYEQGGDFSISNATVPYYPYSSFVGIKAPEGDRRGMLLTDEDHKIQVATVDSKGSPVSRSGIQVELFKIDWKWWWDNSYDNISNYVSSAYNEPIQTGTVDTQKGEGTWTLRVNQPEWGRYFIRMTDPVSGHSAGQVIYLDWPGWAGKAKRGELDGASMLDFSVQKDEYKIGEDMQINLPSTEGNRILVSLETGSKIIDAYWVDAKKDQTSIDVKVTPEMAPNIYVHLTMIQPHGQTANDLPIRLYGVRSVKVINPATVLHPEISMPEELRPEQEFTIQISEKDKKAMAYTIAIVDEGLLDITNYKTPDPWSEFNAREALGIKTWDIYDDVIGAYGGKLDHLLTIGGDGELEPAEQKEVNRFKPVVRFLGPFKLEKGATNRHKVKLPQYIGSVKTMVLTAENGAFGSAEKITPVNQPLMVLATLPRVAGPGESLKLPVNIFALKNSVKNVAIKVSTQGALKLKGSPNQQINFTSTGDKVIYFDVQARQSTGTGKVHVTATSGNLTANYDIELNVIPRNPPITNVSQKVLESNQAWNATYTPVGIPGNNSASFEVSSLPPLNLEQRLEYLIQYPHGCLEQTVSSVFAQLYLKDLIKVPEEQKEKVQTNIEAAIKKLPAFQLGSGGFSYWPGNGYPNNWASNYAGHFLVEAKRAGYSVPEGILSAWNIYQKEKAETWGPMSTDDDNDLIQAYRLYTLALAGNPVLGAMNRMKEISGLSREARWRLALTYQEAGYDNQALDLINGLSSEVSTEKDRYATFGSAVRDQAMILEALLGMGKKEQAFEVLLRIAEQMGNTNYWMSTQTTAYCFIAIAKYVDRFDPDAQTNVSLSIANNSIILNGTNYLEKADIEAPDKSGEFVVKNNGKSPVFVRLIQTGIPIEGTETRTRNNINFDVSYADLNGDPIDISSLKQGMNFTAMVNVSNPGLRGKYEHLALTQLFPSGWEIINTRLEGTDQSQADYTDIRDDRVMNYFDLAPNENKSFSLLLNAAYQGHFYLPAVSVEAMYDHSVYGTNEGKWVEIIQQ